MTNREWLGKMCLADMMKIIIQNSDVCVLHLFGYNAGATECGKLTALLGNENEIPLNDICYNCVCSWLNKKH